MLRMSWDPANPTREKPPPVLNVADRRPAKLFAGIRHCDPGEFTSGVFERFNFHAPPLLYFLGISTFITGGLRTVLNGSLFNSMAAFALGEYQVHRAQTRYRADYRHIDEIRPTIS